MNHSPYLDLSPRSSTNKPVFTWINDELKFKTKKTQLRLPSLRSLALSGVCTQTVTEHCRTIKTATLIKLKQVSEEETRTLLYSWTDFSETWEKVEEEHLQHPLYFDEKGYWNFNWKKVWVTMFESRIVINKKWMNFKEYWHEVEESRKSSRWNVVLFTEMGASLRHSSFSYFSTDNPRGQRVLSIFRATAKETKNVDPQMLMCTNNILGIMISFWGGTFKVVSGHWGSRLITVTGIFLSHCWVRGGDTAWTGHLSLTPVTQDTHTHTIYNHTHTEGSNSEN